MKKETNDPIESEKGQDKVEREHNKGDTNILDSHESKKNLKVHQKKPKVKVCMEEKNNSKVKQEKETKTKAPVGQQGENGCGPKVDSQGKRNRTCKGNGSGEKETKLVCRLYVKGTCWHDDIGTSCRLDHPKSHISSTCPTHLKTKKNSFQQQSVRPQDTMSLPWKCVDGAPTAPRTKQTVNGVRITVAKQVFLGDRKEDCKGADVASPDIRYEEHKPVPKTTTNSKGFRVVTSAHVGPETNTNSPSDTSRFLMNIRGLVMSQQCKTQYPRDLVTCNQAICVTNRNTFE